MKIVKDEGDWVADPSGLTSGDLVTWRKNMYNECPNPKVGDIVIISNNNNNGQVGYKALTSEGYDTRWQRVSSQVLEERLRMIDTKDGDDSIPTFGNGDNYVYLSEGVWIHEDDCWF
ncbi:MAG: Unknown protein [uncultured Sulfurovum sp.]|uniref:Uncharacterized protein n=1 Tax=uncultured Sulfurovum sp. TaxID=269237 RepID=A0A6S6S9J0_9BACT|nr:MAG: Unknown protein [uncultured Sulfurovum sp.]